MLFKIKVYNLHWVIYFLIVKCISVLYIYVYRYMDIYKFIWFNNTSHAVFSCLWYNFYPIVDFDISCF